MKNPQKVSSKKLNGKQITGICMLVVSVIFFVLCIFPSFLGIGRFFQGLFGAMCYPLFVLFFLIGIALSLNMSYSFNKKFTAYLVLSAFGIICLLHTIFSSPFMMESAKTFSDFGSYLSYCLKMSGGITVGGAFLGIFVYFFRALIGLGATYVVFAILATVFVGLVIDYIIYNKKQGRDTKLLEKKETAKPTGIGESLASDDFYSFSGEDEKKRDEYNEILSNLPSSEPENEQNPAVFETTFDSTNENVQESEERELQRTPPQYSEQKTNYNRDQNAERERARNLLFGTATTSQKADRIDDEEEKPRSAREVLFGDRNGAPVPNIFDRSSDERNDWRKQYASKPLQYHDQASEKPAEKPAEENTSYNMNDDGSVKTSWGSYRPTRVDQTNVGRAEETNLTSQNEEENGRLSAFGRPLGESTENQTETRNVFDRNDGVVSREPIVNRENRDIRENIRENREDSIRNARENRVNLSEERRNTISGINQTTENTDENAVPNTEFGSRLSRADRRVRSEDLLADASSLGISAREVKDENQSFTGILNETRNENRVDRVDRTVQRTPEKQKVEKISFENQLNREYKKPSTNLLKITKEENVDYSAEYKQKSAILEATLDTFKIPAKVINVVRGPKVTRYELSMPIGIPVSRVLSYEKDMSMNLAAKHGIRIEAPIPGKNAFGVEVANDKTSMVGLRELLESPEFQNFKGPLPVAIGKNISGEVVIKSLPKMVHCLVAGSTGSGKSVFLHSLIMSLMFKHSPDELRFIMIDPKRVEFSRYNRMPHLMLPEVVTDCSKAVNALNWAVKEMERRFQLLMENECQKIDQYNALDKIRKGEEKRLPYLIIIVDELAELMGVAKKDVEGKIQRITQLGRACGIHMVVATQRPSVDVVTGVIKNNLPTRIAFALSSYVDSKTILDEAGAEKLLGQGDMLFSGQDSNQKIRLQGAYVSDEEIKAVLDYIKENNVSEYDEEVQNSIYAEPEKEELPEDDGSDKGSNEDRMDEYMPQALKLVMKNGKASISMIQRRFSVGYARAARIIDQMETRGFINPGIGNKPRDVKITIAEYNELFGDFDSEN